jgi:maltose/moltooligosaccharide transporter
VTERSERYSVPKTFLLGFGFFGIPVVWALYNAYVPVFLKSTFGLRSSVIGFIMTIDNILAIVLLPLLGTMSDPTCTRLGRRRPYILVGSLLALLPAAPAAAGS